MNLLITNHALINYNGSELFIRDITLSLMARGHQVQLFSPRLGLLSSHLKSQGIIVSDRLEHLSEPQLIHGQHHLPTMAALSYFSTTPAAYLCHGFRPWEERVPLHPRIRAYGAMSPRLVPWLRNVCQIPATENITWLPNFVDTERFSMVKNPPKLPKKALVFSNRTAPGPSFDSLQTACQRLGLQLEGCGNHFGNNTMEPEKLLPQYDVVFATGRSALEALACGCAVICQSDDRCGSLVTLENLAELRERNFSIPVGTSSFKTDDVIAQLNQIDANQTAKITSWVREVCSLSMFLDQYLLPWYQRALEGAISPASASGATLTESQALANYLTQLDQFLHHGDEHYEKIRQGWAKTKRLLAQCKAKVTKLSQG